MKKNSSKTQPNNELEHQSVNQSQVKNPPIDEVSVIKEKRDSEIKHVYYCLLMILLLIFGLFSFVTNKIDKLEINQINLTMKASQEQQIINMIHQLNQTTNSKINTQIQFQLQRLQKKTKEIKRKIKKIYNLMHNINESIIKIHVENNKIDVETHERIKSIQLQFNDLQEEINLMNSSKKTIEPSAFEETTIFAPGASGKITARTKVVQFDHSLHGKAAGNEEQSGMTLHPVFYHIITPLFDKSCTMYRFDIEGYLYGIGKPIDLTYVGYTWTVRDGGIGSESKMNRNNYELKMETYFNHEKQLVLKFGPVSRYCNGFTVYYQGRYGSHYHVGLSIKDYRVVATYSPENLF